ncbi:uncharacterized protein KZ484_014890 isoform 2-T2 [Pholidichthys leucotaenia]
MTCPPSEMYFPSFVLALYLCSFVKCAAENEWCYTGCETTPSKWKDHYCHCGGTRQSPINIKTSDVVLNNDLQPFEFEGFSSDNAIEYIMNNGHTVKCKLTENAVKISKGGLNGTYLAIQFHFHWGYTGGHSGSEHTVDYHRYPMEMHIVTIKENLSVEQAVKESDGIAVLGFFISATEEEVDKSEAWMTLASYLSNITEIGNMTEFKDNVSIQDLTGNVNLTMFYRYNGSLTTPECNEAVVWTVFHEPIRVHKDLLDKFPLTVRIPDVYRPTQPLNNREVHVSLGTPLSLKWCYNHSKDDHHCYYSPSKWYKLPGSFCGGERQSPINIIAEDAEEDSDLDAFTFTNFDNKTAIKNVTNTGHTVKFVLGEDSGVEVSGGGLGDVYVVLQFHFHWGSHEDSESHNGSKSSGGSESHESSESHENSESHNSSESHGSSESHKSFKGSEHSVDSKTYPMEMHIVTKKKDVELDDALGQPDGLAVLAFFIEYAETAKSTSHGSEAETETSHDTSSSNKEGWTTLTGYLRKIKDYSGKTANFTDKMSISDLLGNVDRDKYYRYNGSLTTPTCNEAVVWTVFMESIKVEKSLMDMFPSQMKYENVFRSTQSINERMVSKRSTGHNLAASWCLAAYLVLCLLSVICVCENVL